MFKVVIGNKVLGNRHTVTCESIKECQQALADYIRYHGISGGYEYGYDDEGLVMEDDAVVGTLSYNGRLWDYDCRVDEWKPDVTKLLSEFKGEWRYVETSYTGHDEDYQ